MSISVSSFKCILSRLRHLYYDAMTPQSISFLSVPHYYSPLINERTRVFVEGNGPEHSRLRTNKLHKF